METTNDDPNKRYPRNIAAWNSVSDVDTFFDRFNHDNGYCDGTTRLGIGDSITINDGSYNEVWLIAGFDMEHNRKASDNTTYNNGYGICMIPKTYVGLNAAWNISGTVAGGYKSSTIHTSTLPSIVTKLQTVLGSHIVNRNVLLSSNVNTTNYRSNACTWTTSYATLMSVGQITGKFAVNRNKYDDGEANYKLPLFNYMDYNTGSYYWLRGIYGFDTNYNQYRAYAVHEILREDFDVDITFNSVTAYYYIRPLIYLR